MNARNACLALIALAALVGCNKEERKSAAPGAGRAAPPQGQPGRAPAAAPANAKPPAAKPAGGPVQSKQGSAKALLTAYPAGKLVVTLLADNRVDPRKVNAESLAATLSGVADAAEELKLMASPEKGEDAANCSRFIAETKSILSPKPKKLVVKVPVGDKLEDAVFEVAAGHAWF